MRVAVQHLDPRADVTFDYGSTLKTIDRNTHADERARQRHGAALSRRDLHMIAYAIEMGEAAPLEPERIVNGRPQSKWTVTYEGKRLPVVYDSAKRRVITVLPKHFGGPVRTSLGTLFKEAMS